MLADLPLGMTIVPLFSKLILCAAILAVIRVSARNDTASITPWLTAAAVWLMIADLAYFMFPVPAIDLAARCLLPVFPLFAYLRNSRPRGVYAFAGFALAAAVGAIALGAIDALPVAVRYILPGAASFIAALLLNDHISRDGEPVLRSPGFLAFAASFLLPPVAAFFAPPSSVIYQTIILPLAHLTFLIAILQYLVAIEFRLISERDHLSDTIDSLYGFLLKANESVRGEMELDKLLDYVAQTLCTETKADGSLVLMIDDFEDVVAARACHGNFPPITAVPNEVGAKAAEYEAWLRSLKIPLGEGLIGETAQTGKASFIADAVADPRIVVNANNKIGSAIAVPFVINDRVIGVGIIARKADSAAFKEADFDRASLLGDFASLVINNAFSFQEVTEKTDINTTTSIASDIQQTLLPKRIADLPQASFGCFAEAARGVYSDYYDVIPVRRDKVYLIMADVAGKGVRASMIMVMIRAIIHLVTNTDKDAATILTWVNRGITGKIEIDHFATLQVVIYDPTTGICEYANAGHKSPLLWREASGLVDAIELRNDPIGVERNTNFTSQRFKLENGDILMLYTDGLIETMNQAGRQYGIKSLTTNLHKHHELSSKDIAAKIGADVRNFAGHVRQHDDQTLLVMKTKL